MTRAAASSAGRAAGLVALISALVFAGLIAASWAAAQVDRSVYRHRIAAAIEDGTLARPAFTPLSGERTYGYHYNDCLIASMLVLEPKEGSIRSAISPLTPVRIPAASPGPAVPQAPMCGNLQQALADPRHERDYYHHYLHGDWVLASAMLFALPFDRATDLLLWTLLLLPLAIAAMAGRRLLARRGDAPRDAAYLATSLAFLLFGGIGLYGRSFSFAPSDIVLCGFLLCAWRFPLLEAGRRRILVTAALFGALTAAFEFLVGAVPAALALLLASFAFGRGLGRNVLRQLATAIFSFAGAFALMFAFKLALVAAVWGWSEVGEAGAQLLLRVGSGHGAIAGNAVNALDEMGLSAEWLASSRPGVVALGAIKMLYYARYFEYGSALLGVAVVGVAPLALLALSGIQSFRGKDGDARMRAALLFAATIATLCWYLAFANHTLGHAPFMMRPLSWLAALLCGYLAWLAAAARARAGKDVAPPGSDRCGAAERRTGS
jgi:hypothetical protein